MKNMPLRQYLQVFLNCDELTLMTPISVPTTQAIVDAGHLDDRKLSTSKMLGAERRAFQAAMR